METQETDLILLTSRQLLINLPKRKNLKKTNNPLANKEVSMEGGVVVILKKISTNNMAAQTRTTQAGISNTDKFSNFMFLPNACKTVTRTKTFEFPLTAIKEGNKAACLKLKYKDFRVYLPWSLKQCNKYRDVIKRSTIKCRIKSNYNIIW